MKAVITLSCIALTLLAAACGDSSSTTEPGAAAGAGAPSGTPSGADGSTTSPLFPEGATQNAGPLPESFPKFVAQEGWVEQTPGNSMRLEQYALPGDGSGEASGGEALLVISYWPGGIGAVETNLDRWVGQVGVDTPANELSAEQRWTSEASGFLVTGMHVEGAIQTTEGMGKDIKSTGQDAILAAFIERPGIPNVWTVKVTGPAATVSKHRKAFDTMIAGL